MKQIANNLFMISPVNFAFNKETAKNNFYQKKPCDKIIVNMAAKKEFKNFVKILMNHGVRVIVFDDLLENKTPDSIFPNNWLSTHIDGKIFLYPMFAENRRRERRNDVISYLKNNFIVKEVNYNYVDYENNNSFLEGTGSIVLDRVNKIAYAAISERTNLKIFKKWCMEMNYQSVSFHAYHTVKNKRKIIYHTNVMMCIANNFAVVCLDSIDDKIERQEVYNSLIDSGKEIICITEEQNSKFAGNMLQVLGDKPYLIMSETAFKSLKEEQKQKIIKYCPIINVPINTIESIGGGSVRCMIAEIFLQER